MSRAVAALTDNAYARPEDTAAESAAQSPANSPLLTLNSSYAMGVEMGGDVNAQMAAMMLSHARDKRQRLGEMRRTEERSLIAQQSDQVKEMRQQATEMRRAAATRAIGGMVAGFQSIGAGVLSATDILPEERRRGVSTAVDGSGKFGESAADYLAAGNEKKAENARIASVEAEHKVGSAERRLDDLAEEVREARDLTRDAIDFFRGVNETSSQVERAAIFQRA